MYTASASTPARANVSSSAGEWGAPAAACAVAAQHCTGGEASAAPKKSRFRGVSWDKRSSKWYASISLTGKAKHIGSYLGEREAARAYDAEARKHYDEESLPGQKQHGGFNFPPPPWGQAPVAPAGQYRHRGTASQAAGASHNSASSFSSSAGAAASTQQRSLL